MKNIALQDIIDDCFQKLADADPEEMEALFLQIEDARQKLNNALEEEQALLPLPILNDTENNKK